MGGEERGRGRGGGKRGREEGGRESKRGTRASVVCGVAGQGRAATLLLLAVLLLEGCASEKKVRRVRAE